MKGDKLMPQATQTLDISEHTRVRITIEREDEAHKKAEHILAIARQNCEGLSKNELVAVRSAKLGSESFFTVYVDLRQHGFTQEGKQKDGREFLKELIEWQESSS